MRSLDQTQLLIQEIYLGILIEKKLKKRIKISMTSLRMRLKKKVIIKMMMMKKKKIIILSKRDLIYTFYTYHLSWKANNKMQQK